MFFKKIKLSRAIDRVIEDRFYEQVALEMINDDINLGTWTRAKADANGDKGVTEALYIKYRVQTLHDAVNAVDVFTELNARKAHKDNYIENDNVVVAKKRIKRKIKETTLQRLMRKEELEGSCD